MMELRKEYADIVEKASYQWSVAGNPAREVFEGIALACQERADRPPRELTDAEIQKAWDINRRGIELTSIGIKAARAVIAAFLAKQREPATVKFRAARRKDDHTIIAVTRDDSKLSEYWEWLEPAQEFEVRI